MYNNPFGIAQLDPVEIGNDRNTDSINRQWKVLYNLVSDANHRTNSEGWIVDTKQQRQGGRHQVHPIVKLQIALKFREETSSDWHYKYRPQNSIHGELCMVLSKRAFRVISHEGQSKRRSRTNRSNNKGNSELEVMEIPLSSYNAKLVNHLMVREIAFGPESDPSVRGVALWFHIDEQDVIECTSQQAKRFRWKKGIKTNKNEIEESEIDTNHKTGAKSSIFDSPSKLDSFPMTRPTDQNAYELTTKIIKHRLSVLKTERMSNMKERFESLKRLETQKQKLQDEFGNIQRDWFVWAWPINAGREKTDRNTSVPAVDGYYKINAIDKENNGPHLAKEKMKISPVSDDSLEKLKGSYVTTIWNSFVNTDVGDNNVSFTEKVIL